MIAASLLVAMLPLMRPVSCNGVWWHTARGREVVLQETVSPSRDLLVDDERLEADWLGGAANYLLYSGLGFLGLFLGKIALGGGLVWLVHSIGAATGKRLLLAVLLLVSCEPALMMAGRGLDLVFAVMLWKVIQRSEPSSNRRRLWLAVVSVCWANTGPLSLLALPMVLFSASGRRLRGTIIELMVTTVALSATPLGWRSLLDSGGLLAPWMSEGAAMLTGTIWAPADPVAAETMAFLSLAAIVLASIWSTRVPGKIAAWTMALAFGLAAEFTLPLMATWLALQSSAQQTTCTRDSQSGETRPLRDRWGNSAAALAATCIAILAACGAGGQPRLGWGVAAGLEPRLFSQSVQGLPAGAAFAWNDRATGVVAWSGLRGFDSQQRALLGGRLRSFRLAFEDLSHSRRNRYRRSDGSLGGWWLWLQAKPERVNWIALSADETTTIAAMEKTGFRPLSVDSPVIPYASSYVPAMAKAILNCVETRNIVERGRWSYQAPNHAGLLFDAAYVAGGDLRIRLRQARVFRAMGLPTAALRTLSVRAPELDEERSECYLELANREWRVGGRSSDWSTAVLAELGRSAAGSPPASGSGKQLSKQLREAAGLYVRESPQAALSLLEDAATAEAQFARARLYFETGDVARALKELQRVAVEHPTNWHSIGARDVLRSY
jgi:hypothetical protein